MQHCAMQNIKVAKEMECFVMDYIINQICGTYKRYGSMMLAFSNTKL